MFKKILFLIMIVAVSLLYATNPMTTQYYEIKNQLKNPGFEQGTSLWNVNTLIVSNNTNPSDGLYSAKFNSVALTAGHIDQSVLNTGLVGKKALLSFDYYGGDSTITIALNDGATTFWSTSFPVGTTEWRKFDVEFAWPTTGETIVSFDYPDIISETKIDNVYLGDNWKQSKLEYIDTTSAPWLTIESDPIFSTSAAHSITTNDITNWNTAKYYSDIFSTSTYVHAESDPIFSTSIAQSITFTDVLNWDQAKISSDVWSTSVASTINSTDVNNWNTAKYYTDVWQTAIQPINKGGTGRATIGSSNQMLGVDPAGTALNYKTVTGASGISVSTGDGWMTIVPSIIPVANGGTNNTTIGTNQVVYGKGTFYTSGTNLTYDGTNLGIGVTNPQTKLVIQEAVDAEPLLRISRNRSAIPYAHGMGISFENSVGGHSATPTLTWQILQGRVGSDTNNLDFNYNTTNVATLASAGNVGIGTASPATKLHVWATTGSGDAQITIQGGNHSTAAALNLASQANSWQIYYDETNDRLGFYGAGADQVYFTNAGKVGIGMTPANRLDVKLLADERVRLYSTSDSSLGFQIQRNTSGGSYNGYWENQMPTNSKDLTFSFGGSEKMRLTSDGYLGFGTNSIAAGEYDLVVYGGNADIGSGAYGSGIKSWAKNALGGSIIRSVNSNLSASVSSIAWSTGASGTTRFGLARAGIAGIECGASTCYLGNTSNAPLIFGTNNAETMRIAATGRVVISSTTDLGQLFSIKGNATDVGAGIALQPYSTTNTGYLAVASAANNYITGSAADDLAIRSAGNILMGYGATEIFRAATDGKITAAGVYNNTVGATNRDVYVDNTGLLGYVSSSKRYKTNIRSFDTDTIENVIKLNPVRFDYIDPRRGLNQIGFIAEDVAKVFPEVVSYNKDGSIETIQYSKMAVLLTGGIKDLYKQNVELKNRLDDLEKRIKKIENKIK